MNIDKDIDEAYESLMDHRKNEFKKEDQQLLDQFAGLAMQGICVNAGRNGHHCNRVDKIAQSAYDIAEAMLKERERRIKE